MKIREVTNSVMSFGKNKSQTPYKSSGDIASAYSQILAEKISNIKADVRQMAEVREQLDEISTLHEDLTGEIKIDEDSGNANRSDGSAPRTKPLETIKRFLPDGTIMITTYQGSKIVEQIKHKPHMISVPDYTAPLKPDGTVAMKLEPHQSMDVALLLMT